MTTTTKTPNTRTLAIIVSLAAATVGVVYGYDTGSIAGALLFLPKEFNPSTRGNMGGLGTFALFLGLAVGLFVFIFATAPKGRPLEAIRVYWENGAKWPPERETAAILERRQQEERGAA